MTGSNRRPPACKAGALPAELIPPILVGLAGFEPATPRLSSVCSNQLSYKPVTLAQGLLPRESRSRLTRSDSTTDKCECHESLDFL